VQTGLLFEMKCTRTGDVINDEKVVWYGGGDGGAWNTSVTLYSVHMNEICVREKGEVKGQERNHSFVYFPLSFIQL
jgi:hypothetical protein